MGQTIFTTHFLCFGDQFYSTLWIRQNLENYTFRKSLRKILRKNDQQFRCHFGAVELTDEKELLYQLYRQNFPGVIAPSLLESLQDGGETNVYKTVEFSVYDGDKLIALSFFDLGETSVASILGIYHPAYTNQSLGFYTMIKEMEYAMEQGFKYFYPGYIVPGYQRFDYKTRIGAVDYFNMRTGRWLPYAEIRPTDIPLEKIHQKLEEAKAIITESGVEAAIRYYPLFEANLFGYWRLPFFDYPLLLECRPGPNREAYYLIVFDPRTNLFQLLFCTKYEEVQFYFSDTYADTFDHPRYFLDLLNVDHVIESNPNPAPIVQTLLREWEDLAQF